MLRNTLITSMMLSGALLSQSALANNQTITAADVKAAQDAWGKALIQISQDYNNGGISKAKATAQQVLDSAYGYDLGPVLFKPTLAMFTTANLSIFPEENNSKLSLSDFE